MPKHQHCLAAHYKATFAFAFWMACCNSFTKYFGCPYSKHDVPIIYGVYKYCKPQLSDDIPEVEQCPYWYRDVGLVVIRELECLVYYDSNNEFRITFT